MCRPLGLGRSASTRLWLRLLVASHVFLHWRNFITAFTCPHCDFPSWECPNEIICMYILNCSKCHGTCKPYEDWTWPYVHQIPCIAGTCPEISIITTECTQRWSQGMCVFVWGALLLGLVIPSVTSVFKSVNTETLKNNPVQALWTFHARKELTQT